MISVNVDLTKFGDFEKLGDNIVDALKKELKNQLSELQLVARKEHRYQTRTGQLEKSVSTSLMDNGLVGELGLDDSIADYGKYVVEGHGTWQPDPFLEEALQKREPIMQEDFERTVQEAINKV